MRKQSIAVAISLFCVFVLVIILLFLHTHNKTVFGSNSQSQQQLASNDSDNESQDKAADGDEEPAPASPVVATSSDIKSTPTDNTALGGYNLLIADRGNNRILEVTPDKKIIWQYQFNLPTMGLGADDSFFTDNGKSIIVNLEEYHVIQIIDYATKKVTWSYGVAGRPGSSAGSLNTPDDAYKLPNGDVTIADIKNCRILEIAPDKSIVRQYGQTGKCGNNNGLLDKPNGDTPLPNGHTFISNIVGKNLLELDQNWQPIFSMQLPVNYPSDPQLTKAGNILISDYSQPGQIVEVSKQGKIVWQFSGQAGDVKLNHPSLAIELPNGNILANDDLNHRVIVIDKQTKKIIWQYGVTGKPGNAYGQLNTPDGLDIIMPSANQIAAPATIGSISRHPQNYLNQTVTVAGYVLKQQNGYAIFSDEATGPIGQYDLPVIGTNINGLTMKQKYVLTGILKYQGLTSSNGNPYHLELTALPELNQ